MSFILDAIKKSEDQRQRSKQPEVHSLQSELNYYRSKKNTAGRFVMFLLALIILGLVTWSFWPQLLKQIQRIELNEALAPSLQDTSVSKQSAANKSKASNSAVLASYYNADDELPSRRLIKDLWQLPADYQASIPEFEFSFHFYSTDSTKRSTVIDGRTMREGQMLTSSIKLRVITSSGVILHSNGQFFHINVIEKW